MSTPAKSDARAILNRILDQMAEDGPPSSAGELADDVEDTANRIAGLIDRGANAPRPGTVVYDQLYRAAVLLRSVVIKLEG